MRSASSCRRFGSSFTESTDLFEEDGRLLQGESHLFEVDSRSLTRGAGTFSDGSGYLFEENCGLLQEEQRPLRRGLRPLAPFERTSIDVRSVWVLQLRQALTLRCIGLDASSALLFRTRLQRVRWNPVGIKPKKWSTCRCELRQYSALRSGRRSGFCFS